MVDNKILAFGITKIIRYVILYFSIIISKNFTTQIYMDKVLVNGENPPKLMNFVYLFVCVESICLAIFLALLYAVDDTFKLKLQVPKLMIEYVLPDFFIYIIFIMVSGMILSHIMYTKKYFLYKDDGLRGIRALSDIIMSLSAFYTSVPFNFIITGMVETIKKL
jgi:hypothetical protein